MRINTFRNFVLIGILSLILSSCSNVDSKISTANGDTPVNEQETQLPLPIDNDPEVIPPESDICSVEELSKIESDIKSNLAIMETDADFSLKVESEDGRVFEFNRGSASMTTTYESASTSKWISATVILSYLESAENLSSPKPLTLASRPQDFITSNWPIQSTDPLYKMTLRDLLSFTSGLTKDDKCVDRKDSDFETCVLTLVANNLNNGITPGKVYFYSSSHLQVAGLMAIKARNIAKSVTNSTWQSLFSDFKLKTGLFNNSTYDLPSDTNPRLAGGMHWTGNDYVEFLKKFSKFQVLSSTYTQMQLSDQIGDAVIGASPANKGTGEDWHYGFGLWVECHSEIFNCANSLDVFSSAGAYGAYPFLSTKHKFYGLIARQGAPGTGFLGYLTYAAVSEKMTKWATKDCSQ